MHIKAAVWRQQVAWIRLRGKIPTMPLQSPHELVGVHVQARHWRRPFIRETPTHCEDETDCLKQTETNAQSMTKPPVGKSPTDFNMHEKNAPSATFK
jgi:hypothetical protein